ncbi:MAG: ABC transporter substrate-binding protein, partial [Chloroflexota bacterium]
MKRSTTLISGVLLTVIVLVGCTTGAATSSAPATVAPASPAASVAATPAPTADAFAAIAAAAKTEGQVVSYGMSDDWVNLGAIWKAVSDTYGIQHVDTDMKSAEEITHLLAEKDAPVMDVADIGFDFVDKLIQNDLAASFKNSHWDSIPANFKDADGRWAVAYWGAISFLVNTDLVKNPPTSWADLVKPEY